MDKASKPTGLGILVDEKRVNDLIAQKTGAKAVLRSSCNLLLFLSFIVLFTALALSEPLGDYRSYEGFLRRKFDTSAPRTLASVTSAASFWEYIHRSLMPGIYGHDTRKYYFPDYEIEKYLPMEGSNRLVGVARMRMLKIKPSEGCTILTKLEKYFPTCYGSFDATVLDTAPSGPPDKKTGEPIFLNYPGVAGETVTGKLATYPSGGFMQALTPSHNETIQAIDLLEKGNWIVPGTRVIFIDFTALNFNLGYRAVCRLMFEIDPSGGWFSTFHVDVLMQRHLNPIGGRSTGDWLALLGEVILFLFVLRYLMEEASEFVGFQGMWPYIKWDYFGDAWNILDWTNLVLMIVTLFFRVSTWGLLDELKPVAGTGLARFIDMSGVASNVRTIHSMIAFNTVLTWFKAVKYIAILPFITTFMGTVSMSQVRIIAFMSVFFSFLFGFVLAFTVAYGEQLDNFRNIWSSFVFLSSSLVGNADMSLVVNHAPLTGSLLIYLFVLAMFFVSMNLFCAIIIDALGNLKQEEGKNAKKFEQQMDKFHEFLRTVSVTLGLEYRFRTFLPGLYTRVKQRKKKKEEKDAERDEDYHMRENAKRVQSSIALGPGNPSMGRRAKPASNRVDEQDLDTESEEGSEVDLGPLRDKAQLQKGGMFRDLIADDPGQDRDSSEGGLVQDNDGDDGELDEKGVNLVIEATRHVISKVVDRTYGAQGVLVNEMSESKDVLEKVGTVLEVLQTRTRDLEALQRQLLKHF